MADAPKQLSNARVSVKSLNSTGPIEALCVVSLDSTGGIGSPGAGSTQVSIKEILTSSGGSVVDSTQVSLRVSVVEQPAGGSTVVTVSTGSLRVHQSTAADLAASVVQGSTVWAVQVSSVAGVQTHQLIDRDFSTQVAAVSGLTAPASTAYGLVVRLPSPLTDSTNNAIRVFQVASSGGASSTEVTVRQSTAADLNVTVAGYSTVVSVSTGSVRVHQSSAADLNVTVAGYSTTVNVSSGIVQAQLISSSGVSMSTDTDPASTKQGLIVRQVGFSTTVNVSSLAGAVIVRSSAADAIVTVKNSTIGELLASVQQNSTVWQTQAKIQDSSAVGFVGTTTRPSTGAQGLVVRQVLNDLLSTCFSTLGNNSTSSTVVSSAAALRHKVFAYSITSTVQAINTLSFASSLANPIWTVQMQSMSSGIAGANLAVSPPAWLFATEAASPLVFKIGPSTGTYHVSFSYFSEA